MTQRSTTSPATALSKSQIIKLAAAATLAAAAILSIVLYLLDDPRKEFYNEIELVCVEQDGQYHGFTIVAADIARHMKKREPITCPECGGTTLRYARPCFECGKPMPAGAHRLPPDFCPHCGVAQPPPTIGMHEQIHAPGAHGSEIEYFSGGDEDEDNWDDNWDDEPQSLESDSPPQPDTTQEDPDSEPQTPASQGQG